MLGCGFSGSENVSLTYVVPSWRSHTSWLARAEMHAVHLLGNIETLMICHSTSNAYAARVVQHLTYLRISVRFVVARCRDVPVLRSYHLCRLRMPAKLQHVPIPCTQEAHVVSVRTTFLFRS